MLTADDTFSRLAELRFVGVLRADDPAAALGHARAALGAGLNALELTFTTPDALRVLRALALEFPGALLGAGTVMAMTEARAARDAGAAFLVSPHLDEALLVAARSEGLAYIPGVLTPSEVRRTLALGASGVKLFPAARAGGPAYLRDLRGPFPDLRVFATGGIGLRDAPDYLAAGAVAVGLGAVFGPTPRETAARVADLLA